MVVNLRSVNKTEKRSFVAEVAKEGEDERKREGYSYHLKKIEKGSIFDKKLKNSQNLALIARKDLNAMICKTYAIDRTDYMTI